MSLECDKQFRTHIPFSRKYGVTWQKKAKRLTFKTVPPVTISMKDSNTRIVRVMQENKTNNI